MTAVMAVGSSAPPKYERSLVATSFGAGVGGEAGDAGDGAGGAGRVVAVDHAVS
jgi:hypothetical protein